MASMMSWYEFQKYLAALTAWREGRGEVAAYGLDSLRGILHVIDNRSKYRRLTWVQVVMQYEQFSSMTAPGDPQIHAGLVPVRPDPVFEQCYDLADIIFNGGDYDITLGSDYYFADSIPMPTWAATMTATVKIGHHLFYKGKGE
jgi:N-acetylmuramoyl-L-alanine amidase